MNTGELKAFLSELTAEPDTGFWDEAENQAALRRAHDRWRRIVYRVDNTFFEETVDLVLSNAKVVDLVAGPVTLFGSAPTNGPALEIHGLEELDTNLDVISIYRKVKSRQELFSAFDLLEPVFYFGGRKIQFAYSVTGTYRVYYLPRSNVTWANPADYIDDFDDFHDLLAYLCYEEYAARDQAFPESIRTMLEKRRLEFIETVQSGFVEGDDVSYEPNW